MVKFKLKNRIICALFVMLSFLLVNTAEAFSVYLGTGDSYAWPAVYAIKLSDYELAAQLRFITLAKNFDQNSTYAKFGVGIARTTSADFGFTASVGYQSQIFKILGFRMDWSTFAGLKSYMTSEVGLGLTFTF